MPKLVQIFDDVGDVAKPVKLEWQERTIVFRQSNGAVLALDGWKYGTLMVHSTWASRNHKPITITHWPSKLAVARLEDPDESLAQVEWLWESCPIAWVGDEVEKHLIPATTMQWLEEHQR